MLDFRRNIKVLHFDILPCLLQDIKITKCQMWNPLATITNINYVTFDLYNSFVE